MSLIDDDGLARGGTVGPYLLLSEASRGPLGSAWVATRGDGPNAGKPLLLRAVPVEADDRVGFEAAAAWATTVRGAALTPATEWASGEKHVLAAVPYAPGEFLRAVQRTAGFKHARLPIEVICRIALDLMASVASVHSRYAESHRGFAFAGVSADSIYLCQDGSTLLLDLGLAAHAARVPSLREAPERAGYTAPEQLADPTAAGPAADVFAVGVLLWELLSNRRLFMGTTFDAVCRRVSEGSIPPLDKDVPEPIASAVSRALEKDPSKRFATIEALRDALLTAAPAASTTEVATALADLVGPVIEKRRTALNRSGHLTEPLVGAELPAEGESEHVSLEDAFGDALPRRHSGGSIPPPPPVAERRAPARGQLPPMMAAVLSGEVTRPSAPPRPPTRRVADLSAAAASLSDDPAPADERRADTVPAEPEAPANEATPSSDGTAEPAAPGAPETPAAAAGADVESPRGDPAIAAALAAVDGPAASTPNPAPVGSPVAATPTPTPALIATHADPAAFNAKVAVTDDDDPFHTPDQRRRNTLIGGGLAAILLFGVVALSTGGDDDAPSPTVTTERALEPNRASAKKASEAQARADDEAKAAATERATPPVAAPNTDESPPTESAAPGADEAATRPESDDEPKPAATRSATSKAAKAKVRTPASPRPARRKSPKKASTGAGVNYKPSAI